MNDEVIGKLSKLVESRVCAALIASGYATLEDNDNELLFDNLIINKDIVKRIGINSTNFYDNTEFLKEMINTFPSGEYRCSVNVLRSRIRSFMKKTSITDITEDEMLTAARTWITRRETPYHGHIINFIFKYDNKVFTSRLETIVNELRDDKLNTPNIVQIVSQTSLDDL